MASDQEETLRAKIRQLKGLREIATVPATRGALEQLIKEAEAELGRLTEQKGD